MHNMKNMKKILKTPYEAMKEEFEMRVYRDWQSLTSNSRSKKEAVTAYLMKKYNIRARSTVWAIRRRVEARLAE